MLLHQQAHKHSLKLGLFLSVNNETEGGYPGSLNFTTLDAATLAKWGVDMVYADGFGETKTGQLDQSMYDHNGYLYITYIAIYIR